MRGGPGWTGLVAWAPGRGAGDRGYAGVLRDGAGWAIEYVHDGPASTGVDILRAAGWTPLAADRSRCGGLHRRSGPTPRRRAVGLKPARDVLQIRRPLPAGLPVGAGGAHVRPGPRRAGLARGQQPGVRVAPGAGRVGPRHDHRARARAVVRPVRLPAPRGGRQARRVLLDQGPPRRTIPRSARSTSSPSTPTSQAAASVAISSSPASTTSPAWVSPSACSTSTVDNTHGAGALRPPRLHAPPRRPRLRRRCHPARLTPLKPTRCPTP